MAKKNQMKIIIRYEIEKKVKDCMLLSQNEMNSSHLKMLYQHYKELESTYVRKKGSDRLSRLLCYIIDTAFILQETDSTFVVKLLHNLLKINGNLNSIFIVSFGSCPRNIFGFLLNHATKQKSIFNGYRLLSSSLFNCIFPGTVIECAVRECSPEAVLCLLRYGAMYSYGDGYAKFTISNGCEYIKPSDPYSECSARFCARLISIIIKRYTAYKPRLACLDDGDCKQSDKLFECGRLLLKDMPLLKLSYISDKYDAMVYGNILHQLYDHIPGLQNFFCSPLPLKHACKLAVRKALYNNWHLPHGIGELKIHNSLKEYIDLKYDF